MKVFLLVISILLIIIVLLQSGKSGDAAKILSGGNDLFSKRKERGTELALTRITFVLGITFFIICLVSSF
ncbi:MAG: preprotein translocase subunit SecG [Bacilli bacterium]|jgi:preprotein translocase subunit SecG|nr:preprotein translocase subunit SecG [Bacilli bacterium]